MSFYWIVYEWSCHIPIELEHRAWRAIRTLNYDLNAAGEERNLSLDEHEEIRGESYENAHLTKERAKIFIIVKSIEKTSLLSKNCSYMTLGFIFSRGSLGLGGLVLL